MRCTLDLEVIADAVMAAHAVIEEHGTHEMKVMSRALLFAVGKEIAQHSEHPSGPLDLRYDEPGCTLSVKASVVALSGCQAAI